MRLTRLAEFRLRTALLFSLAVAAAGVLSFRGIYESDLWWHLAQGREAAAGRLVRTNVFNFNYPDYPQAYTSWLYDLAGYLAWQAGGRRRDSALSRRAARADVRARLPRVP